MSFHRVFANWFIIKLYGQGQRLSTHVDAPCTSVQGHMYSIEYKNISMPILKRYLVLDFEFRKLGQVWNTLVHIILIG